MMRRAVSSILSLVCCAGLTACGTSPPKVDLSKGAPARVRFVTAAASSAIVSVRDQACIDWGAIQHDMGGHAIASVGPSLKTSGEPKRESIGMPEVGLEKGDSYVEVNVTSGEKLWVEFLSTTVVYGGTSTCALGFEFLPLAGENYQVVFLRKGAMMGSEWLGTQQRAGGCSGGVAHIVTAPDGTVKLEKIPDARGLPHC